MQQARQRRDFARPGQAPRQAVRQPDVDAKDYETDEVIGRRIEARESKSQVIKHPAQRPGGWKKKQDVRLEPLRQRLDPTEIEVSQVIVGEVSAETRAG